MLQYPVFHDCDAIGQRARLGLIVGDEDRRHLALCEQILDPATQHRPQLRFELSHRLVQQIEIGVPHQRARQRDALLLPSGNRARKTLQNVIDLDQPGDRIDAARYLAPRKLLGF